MGVNCRGSSHGPRPGVAEAKEWPRRKNGRLSNGKKSNRGWGGSQLGGSHQGLPSGCCARAPPDGSGSGSGRPSAAAGELAQTCSSRLPASEGCSCAEVPPGVWGPAELASDLALALRMPGCSPAGTAAAAAVPAELAASCFSLSRRR